MAGGNDDDEAALARALVCYRLIAEAADAPHGARTALLRLAASKEVAWPDGRAVSVTVRTLQRWLERFQRGGLPALVRAPRKDKGQVRAVSEAALARVITLRKEEPARSTPTATTSSAPTSSAAAGARLARARSTPSPAGPTGCASPCTRSAIRWRYTARSAGTSASSGR